MIKLLIASEDKDYADHLSRVLADKWADEFTVRVCSSAESLHDAMAGGTYDIALAEVGLITAADRDMVRMPFVLVDASGISTSLTEHMRPINKYQRISSMVQKMLGQYAEVAGDISKISSGKAHITAVWSPCGGVGKTTVALAYALHKITAGKQATYLSLENFSSVPVYFGDGDAEQSISKVLEKLDTNISYYLKSVSRKDSATGITYFGAATNYTDLTILTPEEMEGLVKACAAETDVLVIDLSSQCDERMQKLLELATTVLIVCDNSKSAAVKLAQFMGQHDIHARIEHKSVLVYNKGAKDNGENASAKIQLPLIKSSDATDIFKSLSSAPFA